MTAQRTLVTLDELPGISARLSARGQRCELVKGELIKMARAGGRHGLVAHRVAVNLAKYIDARDLGTIFAAETGFVLQRQPDTVRAPDVAFVSRERLSAGSVPPGYLELAPDLAVEVVSPNDTASEVQAKVEDWLRAGTRLVWVVYPNTRSVAVYRSLQEVRVLSMPDSLDGTPVLQDLSVPVGDLFR